MIGALLFFGVAMIFDLPAGLTARFDRWRFNASERKAARRARRARRRRHRAAAAANEALSTFYDRAAVAERRALIELAWLAVVVVGLVVALIVAGCGGVYPLEPSPDAGADAGSPPCAAPAGYVVIAHGCDCAAAPLLDVCSTETPDGRDPAPLAGCTLANGETCAAACPVCP